MPNEPHSSRRNNWNNQVRRHALMKPDAVALRFQGVSTSWARLSAVSHDSRARSAVEGSARAIGY